MAFQLPPLCEMGYRVTAKRVICIVYQYLGDENKYAYGASIYRDSGENLSLKTIKKMIRTTALGRKEKNPVYIDLTKEEMESDVHVIDLIREKLHTHGVAGTNRKTPLKAQDVLTPTTTAAVVKTVSC